MMGRMRSVEFFKLPGDYVEARFEIVDEGPIRGLLALLPWWPDRWSGRLVRKFRAYSEEGLFWRSSTSGVPLWGRFMDELGSRYELHRFKEATARPEVTLQSAALHEGIDPKAVRPMLEALRQIHEDTESAHIREAARAAIAQAEGGEVE